MQFDMKFVRKNNAEARWENIRKGRKSLMVDGLASDSDNKWNVNHDFYLGAQLMNDINYKKESTNRDTNCAVHRMLEVLTKKDINKDEELFLTYNHQDN